MGKISLKLLLEDSGYLGESISAWDEATIGELLSAMGQERFKFGKDLSGASIGDYGKVKFFIDNVTHNLTLRFEDEESAKAAFGGLSSELTNPYEFTSNFWSNPLDINVDLTESSNIPPQENNSKNFIPQYESADVSDIVVFNTNRKYTPEGQRIAAKVLPDKTVAFVDIDRQIEGITNTKYNEANHDLQGFVMSQYDRNLYDSWIQDINLKNELTAKAKEMSEVTTEELLVRRFVREEIAKIFAEKANKKV